MCPVSIARSPSSSAEWVASQTNRSTPSTSAATSGVGRVSAGAPETDPSAGTKRFHKGKWYYFCSMACRIKFLARPEEYIAKAATAGAPGS